MDDLMNADLYKLIGASPESSTQEIKKAYRKKALSCHPDKHPNNPRAAELFHELSRVLEILTDKSARAAYDKVLTARNQAKERVKQYDAKRQKFKEDLEAREEAYKKSLDPKQSARDKQNLKNEIERLNKEGSKQVEEEIAFVKEQIRRQMYGPPKQSDSSFVNYRIKIKWTSSKNDPKNGGYDYNILHQILSKYGDVVALAVSTTKKGRGMVEYNNKESAETAILIEIGFAENPLVLESLWNKEKNGTKGAQSTCDEGSSNLSSKRYNFNKSEPCNHLSFPSAPNIFQKTVTDADFENSVLNNLKRAEERKRLLEKLKSEEQS